MAPRLQLTILQVDFAVGMFQRVVRITVMMATIVVFIVVGGDEGIGDHHSDTDELLHGVFSNSRQRAAAIGLVREGCRCGYLFVFFVIVVVVIVSREFAVLGGFGALAGAVVHVEGVVFMIVVGFYDIFLYG